MKALLIQPNSITSRGILTPPLALLFVAEAARLRGHEVKIVDRNVDFFTKRLIKEFKPDVVGISVFTGPLIKDAISISRFIKKELGDRTKIVWGGIHPSLLPDETVSNDFVDIIVIGEGEETFADLLDALRDKKDLKNIPGLCLKDDGKIIRTPERAFIDNLDSLPLINWDLINAKKYLDLEVVLVSSRGCPYNCNFCYNQEFNKRRWRAQSAGRVLEEIKRVEKITKNKHLKFHDDNFTVDKKRVIKIMEGLTSDHSLYIEARPEHIDKELLDSLKKFKKVWIFIGVESGSEALLKKMNKMVEIETIKKAFELIDNYKNILTTASVILGLPNETAEESLKTVEFAKSLKPSWITFCIFTPYPGSFYFKDLTEKKIITAPSTTIEWADYTPDILKSNLDNTNFSKLSKRELKKIEFESWRKVFIEIVLKGDLHKVYRFFKDKWFRLPLKVLGFFGLD